MSKKIINFAICGAGMASVSHADAIKSIDNANLVGVYSKTLKSAEKMATEYNAKVYETYEQLLEDKEVDAVCICTPSGFHAKQVIAALEKGKHVVVEKPVAISKKDADKIAKAVEKSNCVLTVISQNRFTEDIRKVKELYDNNAFGKISLFNLYMKYWRDPEYYSKSDWRGTMDMDGGGALMNQGIHGVDLLLYIAGDVKLLCGKAKTMVHNIEAEDTAVAMIELENGALGTIEASTCAYPGFERRIEILGDKGCVILDNGSIEKLVLDGKEVCIDKKEMKISTASSPNKMGFKMHAAQLTDFIAAVNGEKEIEVGVNEGRKAVALIEDIYNFNK